MQGGQGAGGWRRNAYARFALAVAVAIVLGVAVATAISSDSGGADQAAPGDRAEPTSVNAGVAPAAAADGAAAAGDAASGGDAESPSPVVPVSTHERVLSHEALPCTGPKEPVNFEIFSAGPSVAGVPLSRVQRRCGGAPRPADEPPANTVTYIYGRCQISAGASGCAPPLEIQTWPACERALADYSFEGKPLAYQRLPSIGGAEVVEIALDGRIEVYTKDSTVVVFAENPALARKALTLLRSQENEKPPAIRADELSRRPDEDLAPPSDGATEGNLSCQS